MKTLTHKMLDPARKEKWLWLLLEEFLSMKLATVNLKLNLDIQQILSKDHKCCWNRTGVELIPSVSESSSGNDLQFSKHVDGSILSIPPLISALPDIRIQDWECWRIQVFSTTK